MIAEVTNLPVVYIDRNDNAAKLTEYYVFEIAHSLNAAVPSAFSTGELLIAAKRDLAHGDFVKMVKRALPFGPRTAQKSNANRIRPPFAKHCFAFAAEVDDPLHAQLP